MGLISESGGALRHQSLSGPCLFFFFFPPRASDSLLGLIKGSKFRQKERGREREQRRAKKGGRERKKGMAVKWKDDLVEIKERTWVDLFIFWLVPVKIHQLWRQKERKRPVNWVNLCRRFKNEKVTKHRFTHLIHGQARRTWKHQASRRSSNDASIMFYMWGSTVITVHPSESFTLINDNEISYENYFWLS